jgi:integrase
LSGGDLRSVRGSDITRRHGGLVVTVTGRGARVVPVLATYSDRLVASARFAGERFVVGGIATDRHNVTTRLISSASGGSDLPRLETSRLRATWLSTQAEALGLGALFCAAGFSFPQQLYDLVARLPRLGEAEMVALLGGQTT